ncbi:DUF4157 domain-containing protein [Aquimarina litoralis]|uniref:eCIS core domain-containing protein n=1 Tax=Aquimarina litoralis TaxID=584605 RepID=UPI001C57FC3E|nr:DUF4157 domain-containing protein [Aquimarina litoralis]MBW1296268.1 DUF4157 domain-containing protein [Aquimarina litoralis]
MKASIEKTQEPQQETGQCVQQEPSTGGEAMIVDNRPATITQRKLRSAIGGGDPNTPIQQKTDQKIFGRNNTGLPDKLKAGIETLSGYSMNDVKVHYNSNKPAQLRALAYAQGTDIHLAPGQEKHLPHEAWHVVQQKQGRVKPTMQFKGKTPINDDVKLEKEADVMGAKALRIKTKDEMPKNSGADVHSKSHGTTLSSPNIIQTRPVIQRLMSEKEWKRITSILPITRNIKLSPTLKSIDVAVAQYHKNSNGNKEDTIKALQTIKEKIVLFRKAKSGKLSNKDKAVSYLYLEVIKELSTLGVHDQIEYFEALSPQEELELELELEALNIEESKNETKNEDHDLSELTLQADQELENELTYQNNPVEKALEDVREAVLKCTNVLGGSAKVFEAKAAVGSMFIDLTIDYLKHFIVLAKRNIPLLEKHEQKIAPEFAELIEHIEEINELLTSPIEQYDDEELLKELTTFSIDRGQENTQSSEEDKELEDLQIELDNESKQSTFLELEDPDELELTMVEAKANLVKLKKVKKSFALFIGEEQKLRYTYHKPFEEYFKKLENEALIDEEILQELIDGKSGTVDTIKENLLLHINNLAQDLGENAIDTQHDTFDSLVDMTIKNAAEEVFGKHLAAIEVENQGITFFISGDAKEDAQTVTGQFDFSQGGEALLHLFQRVLGASTVYDVSSANLGIKISMGATVDLLAKFLELGASIFVALRGSINVQDDRRLRAGGLLTLGTAGKITALWRFLSARYEISKSIGITGTYDDLKHFVARIMQQLYEIRMSLQNAYLKEKGESFTDEDQAEIRAANEDAANWEALKSKKPIKVKDSIKNHEVEASGVWGMVKGNAQKTKKKTTFYKDNKVGKTVKKEGATSAIRKSVAIKVPEIGKFMGSYTETEVRNDANPDNNGDYRNFRVQLPSLSFSELSLASFRDSIADIEQFYGKEETPLHKAKTIFNYLKGQYENAQKAPGQASLLESLNTMNVILEWDWVKTEGNYQLQYFRLNASQSHSHSLPFGEVPLFSTGAIGISAEAGAEFNVDRSWGLYEKMGSNTLTYLHTVYNGLTRRQKGDNDWILYRDAYEREILELIKKVGTKDSIPQKEARKNGISEEVLAACENFKLYSHEGKKKETLDTFEKYLEKVKKSTVQEGEQGWE